MNSLSLKTQFAVIIITMLLAVNVYASNKHTLVIGMVSPQKNEQAYAEMQRLVESIGREMQVQGINKTQVYITSAIPAMIQAIKSGKVDWVSECLFVSLLLAESTRAEVFLSKNRYIKKHRTVFFVGHKSKVTSIENMDKKIILFADAMSTHSYFIPYYELTSYGYTPRVYGQGDGTLSSGKKRVFYRFEADKSIMIGDVLKNALNVGVMSNAEYTMLAAETRAKIKVVHKTFAYPEAIELIRPDLEIEIKEKLRRLLRDDTQQFSKTKVPAEIIAGQRFKNFIAEGRDGYVYLRNIIKHNVVPVNFEK
jgi:phosphonate transport system substrate-binding protein